MFRHFLVHVCRQSESKFVSFSVIGKKKKINLHLESLLLLAFFLVVVSICSPVGCFVEEPPYSTEGSTFDDVISSDDVEGSLFLFRVDVTPVTTDGVLVVVNIFVVELSNVDGFLFCVTGIDVVDVVDTVDSELVGRFVVLLMEMGTNFEVALVFVLGFLELE